MDFDMRDKIVEAIKTVLTSAVDADPKGLGLLESSVEDRAIWESKLTKGKESQFTFPMGMTLPLAILDRSADEIATVNGRKYKTGRLMVDSVETIREWRLTHDIDWTLSMAIVARNEQALRSLTNAFMSRKPKSVFEIQELLNEDQVVFGATLTVEKNGTGEIPGLMPEHAVEFFEIKCQYGRFETYDRALKPVELTKDEEE